MNALPKIPRTVLLVVGVVAIVMGAGLIIGGYYQSQLAAEWDSQMHYCGSAGPFEDINDISCPVNPYQGGGSKLGLGVIVALVGGVIVRYGAQ